VVHEKNPNLRGTVCENHPVQGIKKMISRRTDEMLHPESNFPLKEGFPSEETPRDLKGKRGDSFPICANEEVFERGKLLTIPGD
jgi:hypothetical protein